MKNYVVLDLNGKSLKVLEIKLEDCLKQKRHVIAVHERSFKQEAVEMKKLDKMLCDLVEYITGTSCLREEIFDECIGQSGNASEEETSDKEG